ncbi:hypothetical protein Tco_0808211 [Tanacetum coccineum]
MEEHKRARRKLSRIKTSPSNAIGQAHTSKDHGLSKKAQGNGYFALILLSEEAQRCRFLGYHIQIAIHILRLKSIV